MPDPQGNGNTLPFLENKIKLTPCKASLTVNSVTIQTFSTACDFTIVFADTHHTRKKKFLSLKTEFPYVLKNTILLLQ